jgi:hypothetical protein
MPTHLGLDYDRFVNAVWPPLLDRYAQRLGVENGPGPWEVFNGPALAHYLAQPENAEVAAVIRHDLQCVNDVALYGMGTLVRACQKYRVDFPPNATPETIAMSLFLDHRDAFDFAWSRYLLYGSPANLSVHPMELGHLRIGADQLASFKGAVQRWFAEQAKGEQCIVREFQDAGETVILIRHGTHVKTIPFWKDDEISMASLRPALEDVIVYEPGTSLVRIRAGLPKDRREYLRLFAACIAGNEALADADAEIFTLAPLQKGTFNFGGEGLIVGIELRRVKMKLHGATKLVVEFTSPDVLASFRYDLPGLRIDSGILTLARFRFHIHFPGERPTTVTFNIEPPTITNLAERRYSDLIMRYLERQGVKVK